MNSLNHNSTEHHALNLNDLNSSYADDDEEMFQDSAVLDLDNYTQESGISEADDSTENTENAAPKSTKQKRKGQTKGYDVQMSNEDLIMCIRNGIEVQKAKELLVQYNMGLIYNEARRCSCFIPFDDLVQYGVVGFLQAVENYDFTQGQFSTYCTTSVYQCIMRHANRDIRNVHIPEYLSRDNAKLIKFMSSFERKYNRVPNEDEILSSTDISEHRLKVLNEFVMPKYISTDMPYGTEENSTTFGSKLKGIGISHSLDVENLDSDTGSTIESILDLLEGTDRELMCFIHGLGDVDEPMTLDQISKSEWASTIGANSTSTLSRRYKECITTLKKKCLQLGITYSFIEESEDYLN